MRLKLRSGTHGARTAQGNINKNVPLKNHERLRSYRFTLNNYTEKDPAHLEQTFLQMGSNKFCFQEEIGETNSTAHLQGCVFFPNARYFNVMKRINPRIAWQRLNYPKQAIAYCLKSDTRKPDGKQWFHGINPDDYKPKKVIKLTYDDIMKDMHDQMIEEVPELVEELTRLENEDPIIKKYNLW